MGSFKPPQAFLRLVGESLGSGFRVERPIGPAGHGWLFEGTTPDGETATVLLEMTGDSEPRVLEHEYAARPLDSGTVGSVRFVAFEPFPATSLASIRPEALSTPNVTEIAAQLLDALGALHGRGGDYGALDPRTIGVVGVDSGSPRVVVYGLEEPPEDSPPIVGAAAADLSRAAGVLRSLLKQAGIDPVEVKALIDEVLAQGREPPQAVAGRLRAWTAGHQPTAAGVWPESVGWSVLSGLALESPAVQSREPSAPLAPGTRVDHYRVRRLVGRGGAGEVYLARDTVLGRKVALKIIQRNLVQPNRLEAFLAEARTTARFSHPHIVIVYGAGNYEGSPYIAFEFLEGVTLRDRLMRESMSVKEACRCARAIADALHEAHRCGVLHRDLKPSNVMIPRDGRVRVVDFGLAELFGPPLSATDEELQRVHDLEDRPTLAGTPAYMAPEQWRREATTPATDVWSLGVILFEMLYRVHPYAAQLYSLPALRASVATNAPVAPRPAPPGVPDGLLRTLQQCLDKDPGARPTAEQVRDAMDAILSASRAGETDSPYRGLEPFRQEHAALFFGREAEVTTFAERLRERPIMAVVGASGAGKSSFVRAGVVPRLRDAGPWTVITMRPGRTPFKALAARLLACDSRTPVASLAQSVAQSDQSLLGPSDPTSIAGLAGWLRARPGVLHLLLHDLATTSGSSVLLIVDQLEELFTHVDDADERRAFLDLLCSAADDPADPVRVVFTLRDDFLGRLAEGGLTHRALGEVTVVRQPSREALRAIVLEPLRAVGYTFDDPGAVDDMVDEVFGEPACLPLLEFTCAVLWERRDREARRLRRRIYDGMGGVAGALARQARDVLGGLDDAALAHVRAVLLKLVTPEGTRRVAALESVLEGLGDDGSKALETLTSARLVSVRRGVSGGGDSVVELVHESLIHGWGQLARWIAESRDDLNLLSDLEAAAELWLKRGRSPDALWGGAALLDAERRVERSRTSAPGKVAEFLAECRVHADRAKRKRTLAIAGVIVVLAGAAIAAILVAAELAEREREAQRQREIAVAQGEQIDRAAANIGRAQVSFAPFDWDATGKRAIPVPLDAMPDLKWRLHEPLSNAPNDPGTAITEWRRGPGRIEARGGPLFLQLDGRGDCGASWVRIRWFPGYEAPEVGLHIVVPTCGATRANLIEIPAGSFVRGGPGVPPLADPSVVEPEREVTLPAFSLQRTEVSNAAYGWYGGMADVTGRKAVVYPEVDALPAIGRADHPVSYLDWAEARDYCRFLGLELPTTDQWEKAVRGGLRSNRQPRRNVPWGTGAGEVNLGGDDPYQASAPVDSMPKGAGPYGHLHLSGNVNEWTRSVSPDSSTLRIIRGGAFSYDPKGAFHTASYENVRDPRFVKYELGVRCATP